MDRFLGLIIFKFKKIFIFQIKMEYILPNKRPEANCSSKPASTLDVFCLAVYFFITFLLRFLFNTSVSSGDNLASRLRPKGRM